MIAVIIPLKEEKDNSLLRQNLAAYAKLENIQVIPVVKSGVSQETLDLVESFGFQPLLSEQKTRAGRINDGIEQSQMDMILVVHPRSFLDPAAILWLKQNRRKLVWGGFTHHFDHNHPLLKFTSWYSNKIRGKCKGIVYLDHCLFFNQKILSEKRPVPQVEIFEDTLLSEKLKKKQMPVIVNYKSVTSAIRFKKNGILYQSVLNQILKIAFLCGASNKTMNRIYEKGLDLN